jgi:DNA repair and recombination protein RAD52
MNKVFSVQFSAAYKYLYRVESTTCLSALLILYIRTSNGMLLVEIIQFNLSDFFSKMNPYFGNTSYEPNEQERISTTLRKQLGPEFISERAGPGNSKLKYIEGWKIGDIANDIFGFNGWSHSVIQQTVDFIDFENQKYSVGVSTTVRVTLRDGSYHEDIGYGSMDNCKQKGAALEKCKKESVTDAIKRTLKHFGSAMGNCIYSKDYLKKISTVPKVPSLPLDQNSLHRHSDFRRAAKQTDIKIETPNIKNMQNLGPTNKKITVNLNNVQKPATPDDYLEDIDDDLLFAADMEYMTAELVGKIGNKITQNTTMTSSNASTNSRNVSMIVSTNKASTSIVSKENQDGIRRSDTASTVELSKSSFPTKSIGKNITNTPRNVQNTKPPGSIFQNMPNNAPRPKTPARPVPVPPNQRQFKRANTAPNFISTIDQ